MSLALKKVRMVKITSCQISTPYKLNPKQQNFPFPSTEGESSDPYLENPGQRKAETCIESWFWCNPCNIILLSNFLFRVLAWLLPPLVTSCSPHLLHQVPTPVLPPPLRYLWESLTCDDIVLCITVLLPMPQFYIIKMIMLIFSIIVMCLYLYLVGLIWQIFKKHMFQGIPISGCFQI